MQVAYYQASIPAFLLANESEILGKLASLHGFVLEHGQRDAWLEEISIMRQAVSNLKIGHILLEFAIPRVGKRADVVLEAEARGKGWTAELLWNAGFWDMPRGLAAVLAGC